MKRLLLILTMGLLACTFPARHSLGQGPTDTPRGPTLGPADAQRAPALGPVDLTRIQPLLDPHLPTNPGRYATRKTYAAFAEYYLAARKEQDSGLALRYFQDVRRAGDIVGENIFITELTEEITIDSTLIPMILSMTLRLADDNDSLLPHATIAEQRAALNEMGESAMTWYYAKRPDIVILIASRAIRLNERLHQHATFPYQSLSLVYLTLGRTKEALAVAFDAIRVAETPAGPVDGAAYETAARAYFMTGEFDKCWEYTNKALALFFKDPFAVEYPGALVYRAAQILVRQNKAAEALHLLRLVGAPSLASQLGAREKAYFAVATAECFYALGKIDSAERYYAKASAVLANFFSARPYYKLMILYSMAAFYTATQRYTRARGILDSLMSDEMRGQVPAWYLADAWFFRYQADSAAGNYSRALADLRRYQVLHDSLTNVAKNRQLAEMNVQYETEKKNQHITDLEKQSALQTRLQQATLRQDRIIRNGLIAGAALLALVAAVLYSRYRTRRRMTSRLQKLLQEKEWFLREIHHRVKNNLQIVISLLHTQSIQLKDEIAISAFEEIGSRVNAISLVHKKLYQEGHSMTSINMRDYIEELVSFLREGFVPHRQIVFQLDIDPLSLDVAQCVPLGLILNEAVTNAIKYAFPTGGAPANASKNAPATPPHITPNAPPQITIALHEHPAGTICLLIADNGIGLAPGIDPQHTLSLGLQLIHTLTLQLEGTLTMTNDPGLAITIRFPYENAAPTLERARTASLLS